LDLSVFAQAKKIQNVVRTMFGVEERRKIKILNIQVDNLRLSEMLRELSYGIIFPLNVDLLVKLQSDREFYDVYKQADYVVCDSQIIRGMSFLMGTPIRERISGADLFQAFYMFHSNAVNIKIFLLGGVRDTAAKARSAINTKVGRDIVVGAYSPSIGFETKDDECLRIVDMINDSGANVLAVGVGAPKQEKWIMKHKDSLPNVDIFFALGATIDFEAGTKRRAPKWFGKIGLEWFWRLMNEPRRLSKRYLIDDPPFFWLILKQVLGLYRDPFGGSMT